MASVNRGCTVHGQNVGLHGDKTSTGSQCIAARPGMSVMGKWKLYIGDKTTPCPKCGKVGVIASGDVRHSNGGVAVPHSYLLMVASVTLSLSARVFCFMCASFLSSFNSVPK